MRTEVNPLERRAAVAWGAGCMIDTNITSQLTSNSEQLELTRALAPTLGLQCSHHNILQLQYGTQQQPISALNWYDAH